MILRTAIALLCVLASGSLARGQDGVISVGSKNFTESEILAEIISQLIERETDLTVERRFPLGGTNLCHAALVEGELDVYVEYTGTALLSILNADLVRDPDAVYRIVRDAYRDRFGLEWLAPIGFENTYALSTRGDLARERGWEQFSDLAGIAGELTLGTPNEFIERPDGYPGLVEAYGFSFGDVRELDPGLMYSAVAEGQVDVVTGFSTDGRILAYGLAVLRDDRRFFPPYYAAPVVRADTLRAHPELRAVLSRLDGTIDETLMARMNLAVDEGGRSSASVASEWIETGDVEIDISGSGAPRPGVFALMWERRVEVGRKLWEHIRLSLAGVLIAVLIAVPAGIGVHRSPRLEGPVLALVGVTQTIPSLAMLAFLFVLYRMIGWVPALTALVLYALLPVVVNTLAGLKQVPASAIEASNGIGMSPRQRLWMVELPLALPVILAGVRTATVWTVGVATLATYIGAGGLGDFIQRGLARADYRLTLLGAIPAAALALVLSAGIGWAERRAVRR